MPPTGAAVPIETTIGRSTRVRILLSETEALLPVVRGVVDRLRGALVLVRPGGGGIVQPRGLVRVRVPIRTTRNGAAAGARRGRGRGDPRRRRQASGGASGREGRVRRGAGERGNVLALPVHGSRLRGLPRLLVPLLAAPVGAVVRLRVGRDHLRHLVPGAARRDDSTSGSASSTTSSSRPSPSPTA